MAVQYTKLKKSKPFRIADIIVYICLAVVVISLFLAFTVFNVNAKNAQGFSVYYSGTEIFSYNYTTSKTYTASSFANQIEFDNLNSKVTVYTNKEKTEFNVLKFDKEKKTVKVTESNCSLSKECVYMGEISNSGAIVCAPHGIKIVPFGDGYVPPIIGG